MAVSQLQTLRYEYRPALPAVLAGGIERVVGQAGQPTTSVADAAEIAALFKHTYGKPIVTFVDHDGSAAERETAGAHVAVPTRRPLRVGVILSGGQAPGGHNVITGLFDGLNAGNSESVLLGMLGGPAGLTKGDYVEIDATMADRYRNTGGFDMIGSGRTKIETPEQFAAAKATADRLELDAVVVIGGDDSNTNAALLAEYFVAEQSRVQVIGVPKTIDGDLKNAFIETSFGFDTACKTYSELIGNIARDADSAKKYWHFIKLMGRSASHIALECALQTQPNVTIISEEVLARRQTLAQLVDEIVAIISARGERGADFGIVLVPEGLIEFIPEIGVLIAELNDVMAAHGERFGALKTTAAQVAWVAEHLSAATRETFASLPETIQSQLLMDRDPHGNVQVSRIETERLLIEMCARRLEQLKADGRYRGKFAAQNHFFGYEGRCAFPSNFDADYCYALGYTAFTLIAGGLTGYIAAVRNLHRPAPEWSSGGVPLTMMMNIEQRHGKKKPVIRKALVELDGPAFGHFAAHRDRWAAETSYLFPGAIQYFGPAEVCAMPTKTLAIEAAAR